MSKGLRPSDAGHEELLQGGNVSGGVVRVGGTVRRPAGPWTPAVHALLRHLESVGFEGAPRALGIDERGREILEYVPGIVPWPTHHQHLGTDDAMRRAGRLLRDFHDASESFVPGADAVWRDPERAREALQFVDERGTIICHNDPTAWNLVIGPQRWAFIDWDFAGPRPFIWDVAYTLIGLLPVARDPSGLGWRGNVPIGERLRAFVDGYDLSETDRDRLVDVLVARIESSCEHGRRKAEARVEPWLTLWREGHGAAWADMLAYAREHHDEWKRLVADD
jgi:hypothetical protein